MVTRSGIPPLRRCGAPAGRANAESAMRRSTPRTCGTRSQFFSRIALRPVPMRCLPAFSQLASIRAAVTARIGRHADVRSWATERGIHARRPWPSCGRRSRGVGQSQCRCVECGRLRLRNARRPTSESSLACLVKRERHSGLSWPWPSGRLHRAHRSSCRCVEPGRVRPLTSLRQTRKAPLRVYVRVWNALGSSMTLALRAASPCASAVLPMRRTRCVRPRTALRQTRKSPLAGALACVCQRVGCTRVIHDPRPAGGCAVRIGCPADASNPGVYVHAPLSARHAKAPLRGPLRVWRREWDSNPRWA